MKIYTIQYIYEDGYEYWRYYHDKNQRDIDFETTEMIEKDKKVLNIGNKATLRKRDFEEKNETMR